MVRAPVYCAVSILLWWTSRAEIEELLGARFAVKSTNEWLTVLDAADVWCAPVLTLEELVEHEGFAAIGMTQTVTRASVEGEVSEVTTTRSPLRIDGRVLGSDRGAPRLGEHTHDLRKEFAPAAGHRVDVDA